MTAVSIDRLRATYLVPGQHPDPAQVKLRLDSAWRDRLDAALSTALAAALPEDDGIWLIRRLQTDLALDLAVLDTVDLPRLWSRQLVARLQQILASGPDGDAVRYYSNRAAYVAQFVADLAAGRAWEQWVYTPFAALRPLLTSQAIREALLRHPGIAAPALRQLRRERQLGPVLAALGARETMRILADLQPVSGAPTRTGLDAVLAAWPGAGVQPEPDWSAPANRLRLWLAVRDDAPPPPGLPESVSLLLALADLLSQLPDPTNFISLVEQSEIGTALQAAHRQAPDAPLAWLPLLHRLAAGDADWLNAVAGTLAPEIGALETEPVVMTPLQPFHTPIDTGAAGLFLLLPALLDLEIPRLCAALAPEGDGGQTAAVWRGWIGLKCLGRPRLARLRHDPGLMLALGLPNPLTGEAWETAVSASTPDHMARLHAAWLENLQEQRRLSGADGRPRLAVDRCETEQTAVVLHRDMLADYWVNAGANLPEPAPALLWHMDRSAPSGVPAAFANRARPARAAWDYFRLPGLPPHIDQTMTLLAQGVLRTFARRLTGFAWSSPDHLYTNFLTGRGAIHVEPDRLQVQLPASPLRIVLQMAGVDGRTFTLPWRPEQPVELKLK